jgi:hypothetical protein
MYQVINDLLKTAIKALKVDYRLNLLQLNSISYYKQKGQRFILAIVRAAEKEV